MTMLEKKSTIIKKKFREEFFFFFKRNEYIQIICRGFLKRKIKEKVCSFHI